MQLLIFARCLQLLQIDFKLIDEPQSTSFATIQINAFSFYKYQKSATAAILLNARGQRAQGLY